MKGEISGKGSVIVFNKSFEKSVLKQLAEDFPEHKDWIEVVLSRIVDLADVFKNFFYYHPSQKGSYSIKKVLPAITGKGYENLPAITGKGYENLEINNGGDASVEYYNKFIIGEGDEKLYKDLLVYCGLDTEAMVWIMEELRGLIK